MPREAAFSFIFWTKASSLPLTYSAMATTASLALAMLMHFMSVSTVCISPGSRKTWEPPIPAACSETVTSSVRWMFPEERASKIRSMDMTLVTLAGASSMELSLS